jgi:hypothetical protein
VDSNVFYHGGLGSFSRHKRAARPPNGGRVKGSLAFPRQPHGMMGLDKSRQFGTIVTMIQLLQFKHKDDR